MELRNLVQNSQFTDEKNEAREKIYLPNMVK
jgi:hypothetical protein